MSGPSIRKKVSFTLLVMIRKRFSLLRTIIGDITFGLVRMYVTHYRFSWIIFILDLVLSYTDKLLVFRWVQTVAPLVADLFLFCYERDFMISLSNDNQADIIKAFYSTSRYLDDVLNIDNPYFEGMVNQIYPPELQLNKANTSDTEPPFLDLHLSISNGFVSSKLYDKRDDFDFDIVNFPFLDGDVPRRPSYGVYISQLIRFARIFSHADDFNTRNKCLTAKLLKQGYRYHKLRKAFSKFYCRHNELITKFNVGLKSLLQQGLSEPEFYGDCSI